MSTLVWRSGTYICTYREEKSIRRSHFVFRALHCLVISPTWSEIWRRLWHLTAMKMFPTIFVIEPSSPRPSCQLLWRGKKGNQWNKVCRLIFIASPYRSNDSRKRRKIKQTIHTYTPSEQHRQFLGKKVKLNFFFSRLKLKTNWLFISGWHGLIRWRGRMGRWETKKAGGFIPSHGLRSSISGAFGEPVDCVRLVDATPLYSI